MVHTMSTWLEAVEDVPLWRLLVALPLIFVVGLGLVLLGCRPDDGRHG